MADPSVTAAKEVTALRPSRRGDTPCQCGHRWGDHDPRLYWGNYIPYSACAHPDCDCREATQTETG